MRRSGNTGITSWRSLLLIVPPTAPRARGPLLSDQEPRAALQVAQM